jgi:glycerophosphoryl diester phosphodiesterase
MQQRLSSLLPEPIAFAHRGARAHAAENTIEAFALALKLGATGLESDVWLTADGVAVLEHDGSVRHGRKKRPISELSSNQLPPEIPTLEQLLTTFADHPFALSLDLKDPLSGPAVVATAQACAPTRLKDLWLCHPDPELLAGLRPLDASMRLVNSTRLASMREGPERRAAALREAGIDAVNLHHSDWNGGLMALFHRFDRFCLAWDLQQDYLLTKVIRMGADGIYSDWVDRMMEAVHSQRQH